MRVPRMTTRRWMVVAMVALICGALAQLARMEKFTTAWSLVLLGTAIGFYFVAAVACGLVIEWVAPLLPGAERPRDDLSGGQQAGETSRL